MAFQAGGAHALDRALESIAYAYAEMTRVPATAIWEKPGRDAPIRMEKTFTVVPRGVALVIGCNTFPTWNSWPGLFASLVTGNPVVVKPHPGAVLPLAITVQICQEVLPRPVSTRTWSRSPPRTRPTGSPTTLAVRPEVKLDRLHRLDRVRRVARGQRAAGRRLHREVRRQRRRHRLDRRVQRRCAPTSLLARALQRPDVHDPAEPLRPARRHRDRRGPQVCRRRRGGLRRRARPSSSATTPGPSSCSAGSSTTVSSSGSTPRRRAVGDGGARVRGRGAPGLRRRRRAHAGVCSRSTSPTRRVRAGVLRAGQPL